MPYTIETGEPVVNTQRILELIILDRQLTWKSHIETVKAKCSKRLNLLGHLAGSTLLRVHKMLVLSAARKTQLKKPDPIRNKELRIALGAFCINRTQNLLIEAGESTLTQSREIKTVDMVVKITKKPEHPINNRHLKSKKAYDQYGLRPSLTTPFFVKAKETCSMLEVGLKDVDQMVQPECTP
jgi:hypothetical protein